MSSRREQFEAAAALFTYPRADYARAVEHAAERADSVAPALTAFAADVRAVALTELQELYTNTFDLQPACSLDLGWHLFGEDYQRGLLLARMRRELQACGITESSELPDHLSHALLLLARMGLDQAEEFAAAIVTPALERMLKHFPADNALRGLLQAAQQLVTSHFPEPQVQLFSIGAEGARL